MHAPEEFLQQVEHWGIEPCLRWIQYAMQDDKEIDYRV